MNAIDRAIQHAGSQAALARLLKVTPQAVSQWKSDQRRVPPRQAAEIERLTAGAIKARELRPDLAELLAV